MRIRNGLAQAVLPFLLAVLTAGAGAAASPLVAERIGPGNAARTVLGGPDAIGGLGDWALQNGTLCAVVADPSHESDVATTGGGLVDLGLCGRADDQFVLYQELLNGAIQEPVSYRNVKAEVEPAGARLVVRGERDGVSAETRYELDLAAPRRLRIETRVSREAEAMKLYGFAGVLVNARGLTPFSVSTRDATPSQGFVHPSFAGRGLAAISEAATPVDLAVAVGAEELRPGIAYGQRVLAARLETASGERTPLQHYFFSDSLATAATVFARPFWLGDGSSLGWLQLLQIRFMNLDPKLQLVLEQEIWVGDRADVASVTDLLWSEEPVLRGRVDDARAVVHVERPSGAPLTHARVDAEGRFAVHLPAAKYRLRARAPAGREVTHRLVLGAGGHDLGLLRAGAPARIALPGRGPMRLVFLGIDGTPDPNFHDDLRGYELIGAEGPFVPNRPERDLCLTGTAADPGFAVVPAGRYRVLATRGPEFSVTEASVEVRAGETVELAIAPPSRAVRTPGWISSDFHVHSAPSLDNPTAPERRVASYLAEGAEVLVSSEHDNLFDFGPTVRSLGLEPHLASLVGLEVTSEVPSQLAPHTIGHANSFPLPRDPIAYRRGAVANEGRRWREIIADLRALPGQRVIQLNHARFGEPEIERRAFLSHMGPAATAYDPTRPLNEAPNTVLSQRDPTTGLRDIDFDAMELLNGPHFRSYERLVADWFSFLRQGERIVGTANSDSHFLSRVVAAPRNYVRVPSDAIADFDRESFVRAVREGRLYGTTGPLISLELGGARLGDVFRGRSGALRGRVEAAAWVPVSELRVFVSGERVETRPINAGQPFEIPLSFERDAFVTLEVRGEPDEDYQSVLPRFAPLAFTNPIWVDADADGQWTPPGLPVAGYR
jgi:hypothetical protein